MFTLRFLLLVLWLSGCAAMPSNLDYQGCEPIKLSWTFGPEPGEEYIDVCYTDLDAELIRQAYHLVAIPGLNPDTNLTMDHNRDGISGNGIWRNGQIHWGGDACQQYALRVRQKGCQQIGQQNRSYGCDAIAIQIKPNPGIKTAYGKLQPVWHVRLPDGSEEKRQGKAFEVGFSGCK